MYRHCQRRSRIKNIGRCTYPVQRLRRVQYTWVQVVGWCTPILVTSGRCSPIWVVCWRRSSVLVASWGCPPILETGWRCACWWKTTWRGVGGRLATPWRCACILMHLTDVVAIISTRITTHSLCSFPEIDKGNTV